MKEEIKNLGLQSLENISKEVVEDIFKLIEIVIKESENKLDDKLLPLLPRLKDYILNKIDRIKE